MGGIVGGLVDVLQVDAALGGPDALADAARLLGQQIPGGGLVAVAYSFGEAAGGEAACVGGVAASIAGDVQLGTSSAIGSAWILAYRREKEG